MAFFAGNVKSLISFKIKTRHDGYTDQINRIIVTKVFFIASLVMGVDWFHDTVSCIPPLQSSGNMELPSRYIEKACWVKGFYIFPQNLPHMKQSSYYGIPDDLGEDGTRELRDGDTEFCRTADLHGRERKGTCKKLHKYYFLHYQWMPFLVCSMAGMFYMPYILFRMMNTDVISLKLNMKDDQVTCDDIVQNYFNHDINSVLKMRVRFVANFIIKVLYVVCNVTAFYILNAVLDSRFTTYGTAWIAWSRLNITHRYDFDMRALPTPGNQMLPSFGMCDLVDSRKELTKSYSDRITVVCEVSSNILYQYVFLVLWMVLICSIALSALGIIIYLYQHVHVAFFIKNERSSKYVYKLLTFRECEYLEFVRRRDLTMYGVIVNKLRLLYSLPLPKVRKVHVKEGANAPILVNGDDANRTKHHLKHLDSMEDESS